MNSPYWFELAIAFGLICIGNIVLAPFAEGLPKWRRVSKKVRETEVRETGQVA